MSREKHVSDAVLEALNSIGGVRVYEQVMMNKIDNYQYDFIGIYGSTDERTTESFEDMSAVSHLGQIDVYLLCGTSVKKTPTLGSGKLRYAMQDLCERVENTLENYELDKYVSNFETSYFSPMHYISSEPISFNDDETKGLSLMTFRVFYTRI
jgi:hypothetical protein